MQAQTNRPVSRHPALEMPELEVSYIDQICSHRRLLGFGPLSA